MTQENTPKQTVLIVDDTPENIHMLMQALKEDYAILAAVNGTKALELATGDNPPDIVLLDIIMPDMNGYEVCRRLKQNDLTKDIPIIFVTAKSEATDQTKGFDLGAVDYITKPISPSVVLARVRTHLSLLQARRQLTEQNQQLLEAARLRDDVEHITRHDLKTPLSSIIGVPQLLLMDDNLSDTQRRLLENVRSSAFTMLNMINFSLDLFKMEQGMYHLTPVSVDILKITRKILEELEHFMRMFNVTATILENDAVPDQSRAFFIMGEELLSYSMIANLIKNAIEASPQGGVVTISFFQKPGPPQDMGIISVHNQGMVPEDIRDTFFEKYTTAGKNSGTGLGTYSARLSAEEQKGFIAMETSEEKGTTVSVSIPM